MAEHFFDPTLNSYVDGPGSNIPDQFKPTGSPNQLNDFNQECDVYVKYINTSFTEDGLRNLCKKFGNVVDVSIYERGNRFYNTATVSFATFA